MNITGEISYAEIGRELGIDKKWVMKIEKKALAKAAELFKARGITSDDVIVGQDEQNSVPCYFRVGDDE